MIHESITFDILSNYTRKTQNYKVTSWELSNIYLIKIKNQ